MWQKLGLSDRARQLHTLLPRAIIGHYLGVEGGPFCKWYAARGGVFKAPV